MRHAQILWSPCSDWISLIQTLTLNAFKEVRGIIQIDRIFLYFVKKITYIVLFEKLQSNVNVTELVFKQWLVQNPTFYLDHIGKNDIFLDKD